MTYQDLNLAFLRFKRIFIGGLLFFNFICLYIFVIDKNPISNNPKYLAPFIYTLSQNKPVHVFYTDEKAHPFIVQKSRENHALVPIYIANKNITNYKLESWEDLERSELKRLNGSVVIASTRYEIEHTRILKRLLIKNNILTSTIPDWLDTLAHQYLPQSLQNKTDSNNYILLGVQP